VAQALAKQLEAAYVFAEVGKKMGEAIRGKLAAKVYDSCRTGNALAKQLTDDMQAISHDKHLRVLYSAGGAPVIAVDGPSPDRAKRMQGIHRKQNWGFAKLERLAGNIGLVELRSFADPVAGADTVAAAMNFLAHTDALIFDVRRNGGGEGEMVRLICSYLLPAEKPVHLNSFYWREGDRTEEIWTAKDLPGKRYLGKDVYVLTSRRTGSAAEEFAYDLKNLKRATIVGETTGGAAHPGRLVPLGGNFVAFIATGRAINPVTKTNWEGTGVTPDVEVDADKALDAARELALKRLREKSGDTGAKELLEEDLRSVQRLERSYKERKSR
jgi:C-terminal processing protease CtpA/Prc